jgi:putative NADPH-quinone reductase
VAEQLEHLRWAEGVIFVYPTWWYSLPALLKGWLDRVFVPDETFELGSRLKPIVGRLTHIRLVGGISTYGSPAWWIRSVVRDPGRSLIMHGMRPLCAKGCRPSGSACTAWTRRPRRAGWLSSTGSAASPRR